MFLVEPRVLPIESDTQPHMPMPPLSLSPLPGHWTLDTLLSPTLPLIPH